MPAISLNQATTGTAAAGAITTCTVALEAGRQYRIDLAGVDWNLLAAGTPVLRIYPAESLHFRQEGLLLRDLALGRMEKISSPTGTLYFTAESSGIFELDVTLPRSGDFSLTVLTPGLSQNYLVASQEPGATLVNGTAANDLIELGGFGTYVNGTFPGGDTQFRTVVAAGAGFDTLVADTNEPASNLHVERQADGFHLAAYYNTTALRGNSTPGFLTDTRTDVRLDGVEAVQFATTTVYTLTAEQANIARLYQGAFDRAPDLAGLAYQLERFEATRSLDQIASGFLRSPEAGVQVQAIEAFVARTYQNALDRAPEPEGLAWYTSRINSGAMSLEAVLIGISNSPEAKALSATTIFEL
jgi:hypothetical protein